MLLSRQSVLKIVNQPGSLLTTMERNKLLLGNYTLMRLPDKKFEITFV